MGGLGPIKPLQRFPQQSPKTSTRERLALCNDDSGYPDRTHSNFPERGRWLNNASTGAKTFLRASNNPGFQIERIQPTCGWDISHRATKSTQEILGSRQHSRCCC